MANLATQHAPISESAGFPKILPRIAGWWRDFMFAIQWGQMNRILNDMPDHALSNIGISRAEIPAYAERLVRGED